MGKVNSIIHSHATTYHDGAVAMLRSDGTIISLAAERVDRIKHSGNSRAAYDYLSKRYPEEGFGGKTDYFSSPFEKLETTGHHLYHASSVYFNSGFSESAVLVVDGQGPELGKRVSTSIWKGKGTKLDLVEIPFSTEDAFIPQSLGHFYTAVGAMAGMQNLYEEGKTMGLSAYGGESKFLDFFRKYIQSTREGHLFIDPRLVLAVFGNTFGPKLYNWGKQPKQIQELWNEFIGIRGSDVRKAGETVSKVDMDIAYAGQKVLEEMMLNLARKVKRLTGSDNLCLSGGVALNGLSNKKIRESGLFSKTYVFPACGDDGQAIGKLLNDVFSRGLQVKLDRDVAYYGPLYSAREISKAIEKFKDFINIEEMSESKTKSNLIDRLLDDQIVGVYRGSSEIGPRALGHRSIIADPRKAFMRERINSSIKLREWYRPLAPLVLEERAKEYFDTKMPDPFMLFISDVLPEKRDAIPAVTHADGSARVQTINRHQDEFLYDMVSKFSDKTNVPVLLNTSFNAKNEPIVETPEDALRSFLSLGLDALVLQEYLVTKSTKL